MKVKYATQTISRAVSASWKTMKDLKIEGFDKVDPTMEYLSVFDSLFDAMNPHNLKDRYSKAALQSKNEKEWNSLFSPSASYICNLKSLSGKSVLNSERCAACLGVNIHKNQSNNLISKSTRWVET